MAVVTQAAETDHPLARDHAATYGGLRISPFEGDMTECERSFFKGQFVMRSAPDQETGQAGFFAVRAQ